MNITTKVHVCGARDLEGINDYKWYPSKMIRYIVDNVDSYRRPHKGNPTFAGFAYYNIAAVGHTKYGHEPMSRLRRVNRFKEFVEKNKLGTVTIAPDSYNPHYGKTHVLRPAIFTPDNAAIIRYAVKKKWINELDKSDQGAHPTWAVPMIEWEQRIAEGETNVGFMHD